LNGLKKTEPEEDRIFKLADSTHFQTAADRQSGTGFLQVLSQLRSIRFYMRRSVWKKRWKLVLVK